MISKSLCWGCRCSRRTSQLSSMRRRLLAAPCVGLPIWVALKEAWVMSKDWTSFSSLKSFTAHTRNTKKRKKHLSGTKFYTKCGYLYINFVTWWQISAVSWTRLSLSAMCLVPVWYFPLLPIWLISRTKASYRLYNRLCHLVQSSAWAPGKWYVLKC